MYQISWKASNEEALIKGIPYRYRSAIVILIYELNDKQTPGHESPY